jgi:hypothetical protein
VLFIHLWVIFIRHPLCMEPMGIMTTDLGMVTMAAIMGGIKAVTMVDIIIVIGMVMVVEIMVETMALDILVKEVMTIENGDSGFKKLKSIDGYGNG